MGLALDFSFWVLCALVFFLIELKILGSWSTKRRNFVSSDVIGLNFTFLENIFWESFLDWFSWLSAKLGLLIYRERRNFVGFCIWRFRVENFKNLEEMSCSLKSGFSVSGSNESISKNRAIGYFGVSPSIVNLQFAHSKSKEFMGKPLEFSDQKIVTNLNAKAPRCPVTVSSCIFLHNLLLLFFRFKVSKIDPPFFFSVI